MIITQTPFRMSFFGGGTDMESFFRENGGAVLSTTFDKYCYVNVRHLPRFFNYSTELSYAKTERVTCVEDIQHPAIRNAMKMLDWRDPVDFLCKIMGINRSGYYKWKSRQGKLNRYEQDRILLTQLLHEEHELHPCGMGGEKRLRKPVYLLRNETMPQKQCANTQKINKNLGNI